MATAAKCVIAEVKLILIHEFQADHIVEVGELDPDEIHIPSIYVDRVVLGIKE